jgi:hypothetical protein
VVRLLQLGVIPASPLYHQHTPAPPLGELTNPDLQATPPAGPTPGPRRRLDLQAANTPMAPPSLRHYATPQRVSASPATLRTSVLREADTPAASHRPLQTPLRAAHTPAQLNLPCPPPLGTPAPPRGTPALSLRDARVYPPSPPVNGTVMFPRRATTVFPPPPQLRTPAYQHPADRTGLGFQRTYGERTSAGPSETPWFVPAVAPDTLALPREHPQSVPAAVPDPLALQPSPVTSTPSLPR